MSGRVSGIASALGYTPDIFMYTLLGSWMDTYGATGYKMTWAYAVVASLLCVLMAFILSKIIGKKKAAKAAN